jgi:hypothetical protein
MPGGLSRSFPAKGDFIISNQSGGISKDTWVLGPSPQNLVRPVVNQPILRQVKNILPSRTGESLFWLGRYLDRAVINVRMMRIVLKIYNERDDEIHPETNQTLVILLKTLSAVTGTLPGFRVSGPSQIKATRKGTAVPCCRNKPTRLTGPIAAIVFNKRLCGARPFKPGYVADFG